ncbi:MAG: hypothetical protein IT502_14340 [Rubrivivax sp.]|jgi:hypothetical protein|nr:hypothetical protein [Rubrivivax sp.]
MWDEVAREIAHCCGIEVSPPTARMTLRATRIARQSTPAAARRTWAAFGAR